MRVTLSVLDQSDPVGVPVVLETEPSLTVRELSAALAGTRGGPGGVGPVLYRGTERLDPAATVAQTQLFDGTTVGLGSPGPDEREPGGVVELRLVSGPEAGVAYRLPPGQYDLGSDRGCRVRLGSAAPPVAAHVVVRADGTATVGQVAGPPLLLDGREVTQVPVGWPEGGQLAVGTGLIELAAPATQQAPLRLAEDGSGWEFNRPPRFVPPPAKMGFRLPRGPGDPPRTAVPLFTVVLIPVIASIVTVLTTGNWRFIFLGLLSPAAALINRTSGRRRAAQNHAEQVARYEHSLASIRADIDESLLTEQRALRLGHPDPAALRTMATAPSDRLWERRFGDADFLDLRIGTGTVGSRISVEDPAQEEHRRTNVLTLNDVPATVPVRAAGVVGVAGAPGLARWLVAEAAVLHAPADLRIVVLTGTDPRDRSAGENLWGWCRWLPHTRPAGDEAYALVGTTAEETSRRVAELLQIVARRTTAGAQGPRGGAAGEADVLVVLDGARRLRSLPGVVPLLREGPAVGVYAVCLEHEERALPEECGAVVVGGPDRVRLRLLDRPPLSGLRPDTPGSAWFEEIARGMAPLRGVGDTEESVLPGSVRLLDLLGLEPPTADAVRAGWVLAPRSTRALLGAGIDGDFAVDLVRDGPHALIAGTTGSGKSELLQTLVAGLAVANRPDEMTFVLVDYKGGSAFAECAELPHTVGMVTDLDTHLVERALVSLGAELRRREHLLAEAGAKDIADYVDRRNRDPSLPALPRLVLVIDEFASMVRELPDFVTGLVNIAQRGRSLGIHLVLATQRPSGAVTADIRANTNLRIALRTTDTNESRDIIDAPDAGELSTRNPGRAYARLSHSALLPFQTGRVGGRRPGAVPVARAVPVAASEVAWRDLGAPVRLTRAGAPAVADDVVTDMAVLAEVIAEAARLATTVPQPSPWLPALPEVLTLAEVQAPPTERPPGRLPAVTWGLVDLPAEQSRAPLTYDLDTVGHLHVAGAGRSGRSQALRTLAAALASAHGVADLHLYGIDCGNGALLALAGLPHCGAVVDHRSPERLGRLLDKLGEQLRARQGLLGARGVADLAELRAGADPGDRPAHIVVLVDRFEVFDRDFATFDNGSYLDRFTALMRDGASAGIHVVLAGDRILGSSRYASTTDNKIVLRLNDAADWSMMGLKARDVPEAMPPGRALRPSDSAEVQVAVLLTGGAALDTSGSGQADALTALAARLADRETAVPPSGRPARFLPLPDRIDYSDALAAAPPRTSPMWALVGIGGDELDGLGPDLRDTPTFVIAGPPRSGRSTALLTMARSLIEGGTGLLVVAPRRSPLRGLAGRPGVAAVITDADVAIGEFREALRNVTEPTGLVLVDDAELVVSSEIATDLAALARGAAGEGWALVVAGNADALSSGIGGWMAQVRRNRTGLLLSPQSMGDGEAIGIRLSRGLIGQAPVPGRAHLHLGDGRLQTVQVPRTTLSDPTPASS